MILISADWHIKKNNRIFAHNPEIVNDLAIAIDFVSDFIFENKIDAVLLAGDVFDQSFVTSYSIDLIKKFIHACKSKDTKIFFIQGQHDKSEIPLLLAIDDYCQYVHNKSFSINNLKFFGWDFEVNPEQIGKKEHILFTHLTFKELTNFLFGNATLEQSLSDIVISGDFHGFRFLQNKDKILLSPGPLVFQKLNQTDQKVIVLIDSSLHIQSVPVPQREIHIREITNKGDFDDLLRFCENYQYNYNLPQDIRRPILVLNYNPEIVTEEKLQFVKEKFILFLNIMTSNNNEFLIPKLDISSSFDVNSLIFQIVDRLETKVEIKKLLLDYVANEDLTVFERYLEEGYVQIEKSDNKKPLSV